MHTCTVCSSTNFYKEAGYFFCQTCQTQNENIREEVFELHVDSSTRLRKTRIRQLRSETSGEELGWTSWELYNFVLIGLTHELIELGVTSDIKMTILQLWATYLRKIEVAFLSTNKKCIPKLARRYNKRDAEIIYGKVKTQKRKRKRTGSSTNTSMISGFYSEASSGRELNKNKKLLVAADYDRYLQSQASSEGDDANTITQSVYSSRSGSVKSSENSGKVQFSSHAKEEAKKIKRLSKKIPRHKRAKYKASHISTQYKTGPHVITPMKLWAIVYLALRIHNQPIQLADMLRYGREGHLSYYKLDHLLPPEVSSTKIEKNFLSQSVEITHKGMRRTIASMAKFLGVWNISCPDFLSLINRYCQELALPRGIQLYTERLVALAPPKMIFNSSKSYIPNYEGRAIAFIIVVLKTLFGLDGVTEYQISRIAEKINRYVETNEYPIHTMDHGDIASCYHILNSQRRGAEKECKCHELNSPCIIVHGGAGNFSDSIVIEKMTACKKAAINGYKFLLNGENSIDAVEAALWWLECDEFFNCSYGSALNELGKVQMDASIMDGLTFSCGSVAAVSNIEHPITLAKYVLHNFPNSIFVGDGAKQLAKHANINWISEGNMEAPIARIAFNLTEEEGGDKVNVEDEYLLNVDMLKNSFGTVGCVAYDGYSIAAGTTTGGINRKLLGRVGDSPILGCGTYATRTTGCSLSGHGESIMKLGLARAIVEDMKYENFKENALQKHISRMLKKFDKTGGGIMLQSNGCWATYFTSEKMPYAVIVNDLITYGARLHEEKKETYSSYSAKDCECRCPFVVVPMILYLHPFVASDEDLLGKKLFSFDEWQRYIECRKTILAQAHFPTRMKYNPESFGMNDLYIKFLEHISSKTDKKEPDTKNSKHFLPEELITAMTKHISSLSINDLEPKVAEVFPSSLTPLHSYLQHLLDHPLHDVPTVARKDFFLTKIGYITRPELLIELAVQCNLELEVIDSSLHFLEKYVPPFEQPKMPSIKELKQLVDVEDDSKVETRKENKSESLNDYLHAKLPCKMKFDTTKQQYYDNVQSTMKNYRDADVKGDFTFTETLPNGKLAIPADSDSEDDENEDKEEDTNVPNSIKQENILLKHAFRDKYNLHLSVAEKEAIRKLDTTERIHFKKQKLRMARNAKGQFIKGGVVPSQIKNDETLNDLSSGSSTRLNTTDEMHTEESTKSLDIGNANDIDTMTKVETVNVNNSYNSNETSAVKKENHAVDGKYRFFRPFKEYWMYHCIFSRVKPKNFAVFERALPRTFRWLLNECALIVEMSTEDLYEEVCLIETYHTHVLKSCNSDSDRSNDKDSISKNQLNLILSKW